MSSPTPFSVDFAVHDAALALEPVHQEDFQRLVKVLTQIHGFRLYFAEMDSIPYRDTLIAQLDGVLQSVGKSTLKMDLSIHDQNLAFEDFEASLAEPAQGTVIHLLNSELWLAEHAAELNIRRNAIASRAQCACVWWLPRSAIARVAKEAPDVWSWRHGVFSFALVQVDGVSSQQNLLLKPTMAGYVDKYAGTLPQKSKRLANIRQLLAQEMGDEMRWPLVMEMADLLDVTGHPSEALELLRSQALPLARQVLLTSPTTYALTMGGIADILTARGELDEALRILRDEVLPMFEVLGNVQTTASTMSRIADVLQAKGELDEALRIRREEMLPIFEKLGDVRSRAVTLGRIAEVLKTRGELDEALRIFREEVLPAFEKLGDVRSCAVTKGGIADVLQARGELDEALRILRKGMLPVYEKLGDVRSLLICKFNLAQLLAKRGHKRDHPEINTLLRQAHALAKKLGAPEQAAIKKIYRQIFKKPL